MIEDIFNFLSNALTGKPYIALFASFGWGVMSILLSPCHLSSIPLIIGYINSQGKISIGRTFYISLLFAVGILITIGLIGVITTSAGRIMGDVGSLGNYIVAIVFFIIGLYLMDIIKIQGKGKSLKPTKRNGLVSAFVLGLIFGIGLGPCTFAFMAPVLGVVFKLSSLNIFFSMMLLLAFAIGHCTVIVISGTLTKKVQEYLNWSENSKILLYTKRICGFLVLLGGVYFIYLNL
ncbi:MAG: cytochrome C biogenesis protein [Ignavibacteria bacterium]|nr:cytochrome C biogenesis protein [Ignavibacteria bacterium]